MAESDDEVLVGEAEVAQGVDGEGDELGVSVWGGVADDVAIELEELAEATALLAFVAEEVCYGEPLDGFTKVFFFCGDDSGQGGGHFWAEGDVASGLVFEVVELGEDFFAACIFAGVEVDGFEGGGIVFVEAVGEGGGAPGVNDDGAFCRVCRVGVAEPGEWLHGVGGIICCDRCS